MNAWPIFIVPRTLASRHFFTVLYDTPRIIVALERDTAPFILYLLILHPHQRQASAVDQYIFRKLDLAWTKLCIVPHTSIPPGLHDRVFLDPDDHHIAAEEITAE